MANKKKNSGADAAHLKPYDDKHDGVVNAVIETPMGSQNKFDYDVKQRVYKLSKVLPDGMVFPAAFGFVPSTLAADGDPEDILVLMDQPVFCGCVVPTRLLGVIEAEQTDEGNTMRNDRLIGVAKASHDYSEVKSIADLPAATIKQIEHFFVNYNRESGKKFKVLDRRGPKQAKKLLRRSMGRVRQRAA